MRRGLFIRRSLGPLWLALATATAGLAAEGREPLAAASEFLVRGLPDSAVETLVPFTAENPEDADGQRLLGIALSLLGRRSAALGALEACVALQPGEPANHLALGQSLARFGENARAKAAFGAALELDPELGPAHEGMALALAAEGLLEDAVLHFSQALDRSGGQAPTARLHYLRGRAHAQLDRPQLAASDFEAAMRLDPSSDLARLELGLLLSEGKDAERAASILQDAASRMPDSFEAHYAAGLQLLRNDQADGAVRALRRALEIDPASQEATYALGRALRALGRVEEARRYLTGMARAASRRAVDEAKVTEAGRLNDLGLEAEASGDVEGALARYEAAIAVSPENVLFRRNAALALCRLQRWGEAKVRLREVLEMAPGDPDATKALYIALDHAPDGP